MPVTIVTDLSQGTYTANIGGVTISDVLNSSATSVGSFYLSTSVGGVAFDNLSVSTVPEPSAVLLMAMGLVGLLAYAWRKQK
jgi:predicted MFS family arabinose efflux permease